MKTTIVQSNISAGPSKLLVKGLSVPSTMEIQIKECDVAYYDHDRAAVPEEFNPASEYARVEDILVVPDSSSTSHVDLALA